jgi:O-antigen ligase
VAYGAAHLVYPQRHRPKSQMMSLFPLLAVLSLALVWLPSPLSSGDFSLAFLIPFLVMAWALLVPGSNRRSSRAIEGESGRGLWIELGCVSIALVFAAASTIHSPEPLRAFRVILPMAYGFGAMIVLSRLVASQARRVAYAVTAAGALVVFLGLMAIHVPSARHLVIADYRFKGFFDNANQLSLCIIAILPLSLALFFTTRRPPVRTACLTAILILSYALVLTGAKTALAIGFVTTGLVFIYHFARNDQLWKTVTKSAIAVAVLAVAVPAALWFISWSSPIAYGKIVKVLAQGVGGYESIQSREMLWAESWRLGTENPWLGAGAGTRVISVTNSFYVTHSHNVVLDYFRGLGVFGALAMLVLLLAVTIRAATFYASTVHKGSDGKWLDTITTGLYLGALGYFAGNQLSDSLSPSTSFLFWVVYSAAYLSSQTAFASSRHYRLRYRGRAGHKIQSKRAFREAFKGVVPYELPYKA